MDRNIDLTPVTDLMKPGRVALPSRTCRTRVHPVNGWQWKRLYASQEDAVAAAHRSGTPWYACPNCGFWHLGHRRKRQRG